MGDANLERFVDRLDSCATGAICGNHRHNDIRFHSGGGSVDPGAGGKDGVAAFDEIRSVIANGDVHTHHTEIIARSDLDQVACFDAVKVLANRFKIIILMSCG